MLAALLALALALPAVEQLTLPSLPKPLADLLRAKLAPDQVPFATFDVRRFPGRSAGNPATLWVISLPCAAAARAACASDLYLQAGKSLAHAGTARGELVEVDYPAAPSSLPDQLYFYAGTGKTETRLRLAEGAYAPTTVIHRFRDPLTQETLNAAEMRHRAFDDLQAGNAAASAGRYMLLCNAECEVGDLEALAAASLGAHLFPQAERALRAAIAQAGHQPADWKSLATLLRAEGRNADATEAERRYATEATQDGG